MPVPPTSHLERLFRALGEGDTETVEELLTADRQLLGAHDGQGRSLVLFAIYAGQPALAKDLVRRGAPEGLHEAAALGDLPRTEELLRKEAEGVARYSPDGWTPLHLASFFGHLDVCEALLHRGAPVHAVSHNAMGNQSLHAAVAGGRLPVVMALLAAGAEVNSGRSHGGYTPLHLAAGGGDLPMIQALLSAGAELGARDESGLTPVELARRSGEDAVVELLLREGARDLKLDRPAPPKHGRSGRPA